ncbi:MAG: aminotransferase class I/II-fold pyridoxal phosphate-dependent enzyme, partial [Gemmatimonadetes bacterium]|nr:aminotransferase class I/II-fold pyridoxal phosphate-dependent enzyme [Gemmatimonadota bacterium]
TAVASDVGVVPDEIVLLDAHSIPRTSSGKIQRRACRLAYFEGTLERVGQWTAPGSDVAPPAEAVAAFILDWIARELPADPVRLHAGASPRDLGLDSLSVTLLTVVLEERLHRKVTPAEVWEQPDIRSLARHLTQPYPLGDAPAPRRRYGAPTAASTDVTDWAEYRELQRRRADVASVDGTLPFFRAHEGMPGRLAVVDGREVLNFSSYNYLGLAGHPGVIAATQEAVASLGTSVSASRVVSGERSVHVSLEREIAAFLGVDAAVAYVGGHQANTGTISHLVGADDVVLCDAWLHNSSMQGAAFSGARRLVFPHNDWRTLDALLARVREEHRRALVLIEGVYSADGDVPDLARFVEVKARHHALLMVDEAHSMGVLGATGRGIAEHAGVDPHDVDVWMGTLSKSLASCGGYIAGSAALVEYLKFTAPAFVFSAGMTPANAAAALAALRILRCEPERVTRLRAVAREFANEATAAGLDIGSSAGTPVVPVLLGDSALAIHLSGRLLDAGISVAPMVAPAVPEHLARLRFFITSEHTSADVRHAVHAVRDALEAAGRPVGVAR